MQLTKEEIEQIIIAAWFHDTEFSKKYETMKTSLNHWPWHVLIRPVTLATKMSQQPTDSYAEVLCDADIFYIGTPNIFYKKLLFPCEWDIKGILHITNVEWHHLNRKFLHDHHFKT